MSDLLQVADLERAKLHDTFRSEVITGKAGGLAGGADIEFAINAVTSQSQKTLPKILADIDWSPVGKFADGVTFTKTSDFALDGDGTQWVYIGADAFPVTVAAGFNPVGNTDYQVIHVSSLQNLSGIEDPSKLDNLYRRSATFVQVENGDFEIGSRLSLIDRDNAKFDIKPLGSYIVDGYSVIYAGSGKVAILAESSPSIYAFGAKGNWNAQTQTGDDDSASFQAFINYMAAKPSKRKGGIRAIFLGDGQFKISSVTLTTEFDFGIDIFGNGRDATVIWSDPADTNPTITGEIEFVTFRNMTCFGSLSESGASTVKKDCFYRGKLPSGRADIDVKFVGCHVGYATDFVQAYGRGVIFQGGSSVYITNLMNIVCDASTTFSGAVNDTVQTGMRHYTVAGAHRADVVSRIIKVSGTAAQKDFINSILIDGNDFASCDRLIDAPTGRLINPLISANQSIDSFAGGVVTAASLIGAQDIGNSWKNSYNNDLIPADNTDTIDWLYLVSGAIAGLTINGTYARGIKNGVVSAGAASTDVKVIHNQFPQAFTTTGNANRWVFSSAANCDGLTIDDNSFTSNGTALTYQLFDATVQTSKATCVGVNKAPWLWADSRIRYTPKLLINGVQTATSTTAQGRYKVDSHYVYVEAELAVDPVEVTGNVSITLPSITAIAEAAAITGSYAGSGLVNRISGFTKSGYAMAPIQINTVTQEAELYVEQNLSRSRLSIADSSGVISIFVSFKYRYQ